MGCKLYLKEVVKIQVKLKYSVGGSRERVPLGLMLSECDSSFLMPPVLRQQEEEKLETGGSSLSCLVTDHCSSCYALPQWLGYLSGICCVSLVLVCLRLLHSFTASIKTAFNSPYLFLQTP